MANVLPPAQATDEILIQMEEIWPGTLCVEAVELSLDTARVRFVAAAIAPRPDQAFGQETGGILTSICDGAEHAQGRIERPDFHLRLPRLTLAGYALSSTVAEDGRRRFELRVGTAGGNPLALFRQSARNDVGLALFKAQAAAGVSCQPGPQRLFDEMLSQLYLPLVNLNAYLRHMLDGTAAGRGESLSNSVVQLKTRTETLQFAFDRMIAEIMVDKYAAERDGQLHLIDSDAA